MDYDGTIAPVVAERDRAAPQAGASEVLSALARRLRLVGVVSGRPLGFLLDQLGRVPGLSLFGLYGLERSRTADGRGGQPRHVSPEALLWEPVVSQLADEAQARAPEGVEVERKGLSFALHFRGHPELEGWVRAWASQRAELAGLRAQPGRLSLELLPPVPAGKGLVVSQVAAGLQALCFAGDDWGDLPAFEALRRLRAQGKATLSVGVASHEQPPELEASVDVMVGGPRELVALLAGLAEALDARAGAGQPCLPSDTRPLGPS